MVCLSWTAYFRNRLVLCLYGYKTINGGVGMNIKCCFHCKHSQCKVYMETYHCDVYNKDFFPHELCGDEEEPSHFESI